MSLRKIPFVNNEFYHIYNRGVDKRDIFSDQYDVDRFFQSMKEFNTIEPIGSIYENSFSKKKQNQLGNPIPKSGELVSFVCYCLNPNHFHFILTPLVDNGVCKFMHKLGLGYTNYFNEKNERSGALFQGSYKATHINSNEYLLHASVYVNLNNHVHQLGNRIPKLVKSSWGEYIGDGITQHFCKKDMILGQFNDDVNAYKIFAKEALEGILERRKSDVILDSILLE